MNRQQIIKDYDIDNTGRIRSPGKFEGEMIYVPYFWDAFLNGCADSDNGKVLGFNVTADDKAMFPELKRKRVVKLYERDDGFVCEI